MFIYLSVTVFCFDLYVFLIKRKIRKKKHKTQKLKKNIKLKS